VWFWVFVWCLTGVGARRSGGVGVGVVVAVVGVLGVRGPGAGGLGARECSADALVGDGDLFGPWPCLVEVEVESSAAGCVLGCDV